MRLKLLTFLLMLSLVGYGQSQVKGKVTDDTGQGLPGVNVLLKGTTTGTLTNVDGDYVIADIPTDGTLVFSYIGFLTQEVAVAGQSTVSIRLAPDTKLLQEVVVIGYGTTSVKEVTGAVASVGSKDINSRNPVRLEQALQGQLAGVNVTTASGAPGGALNIRIRGVTTTGNNNPYVLVDGIPYSTDGLSTLNPADIESVDVLKDAAAAIYGVLGANGVIFITTKKGKKNMKPTFDFSGYVGVQQTARKIDLLNAQQFAVLKNEAFAASNLATPYNNTDLGSGTDWQKEIFGSAPIQNYNLSATGGSDKSTYSVGGSYMDQQGIIGRTKSEYKRFNFKLNLTNDLGANVTLTSLLLYTNESRRTLPESGIASVLYNAINASPIETPMTADGKYTYLEEFSDIINPIAQIHNTYNFSTANKLVGKEELAYKVNSNFDVTGRAGYNFALVDSKVFSPLVYYGLGKAQNTAANEALDPNTYTVGSLTFPRQNSVNQTRATYLNFNLEAFVNFHKTIGTDHKVKAVLGTAYLGNDNRTLSGTAFGVPYNSWQYAEISAADPTDLQNTASSSVAKNAILSYFARGEYAFKDKYLASVIMRRDASTRFGRNNRFGYFPSVLLGWVVSQESFFKSGVVSFLKIRGGYGTVGNDNIGNFRYRAVLGGEGVYPFNDQLVNGVAFATLGNQDLKWETTHNFNIGADLNMFHDKIAVSADYFIKTTKDLLFQPDVSGVLGSYGAGGGSPYVNAGTVRNSGLELAISYDENIGRDFRFNVRYNITTLKNEVTAMAPGVDYLPGAGFGVGGEVATRMQKGYPMGYFFGYKTDGVYQTAEDVTGRGVTQAGAQPGDLRYVDKNGDGVVNFGNDTDKTKIGSPFPTVTMGLSLGANYKGIDFSTLIYTSLGNSILRNYERQQPLANNLAYKMGRWTGPGSTNSEPRLIAAANPDGTVNRNNVMSDYFLESGSYARIKNIQLGYTLPADLIHKIGATKLRVYVAVNNLYTFTKYRGFDPDVSNGAPLGSGIDSGFYPQSRTFMAGLNLTF